MTRLCSGIAVLGELPARLGSPCWRPAWPQRIVWKPLVILEEGIYGRPKDKQRVDKVTPGNGQHRQMSDRLELDKEKANREGAENLR
jgi:hypothetical protein